MFTHRCTPVDVTLTYRMSVSHHLLLCHYIYVFYSVNIWIRINVSD